MEDNKNTADYFEQSRTGLDGGAEAVTPGVTAPAVKRVWPGVLFWIALSAGYVALALAGLFQNLWFAAPLILTVVMAQALERAIWVRRLFGLMTIFLAVCGVVIGSQLLFWKDALDFWEDLHAEALVIGGFIGCSLVLPCLLRAFAAACFRLWAWTRAPHCTRPSQ